jgi:hypothetical protein
MGLNNNNITTLDGQNFIDMGGSVGSPFKIECNFPNPSGDLPASDVNIQINPRNQVVIGGGSSLNVGALTGINTINNIPFPTGVGVPIGSMLMWPVGSYTVAPNPPAGYLWCNGSLQNIADYPVLAGLLGVTWSPTYPSGPNDPTKFYLPDSRGRLPMGGIQVTYQVQASFQGLFTFNLPGGGTRVGARFNEIQQAVTGGPAQLYRGMQVITPSFVSDNIVALFSAGGDSGSGWYDDMYVLFNSNYTTAPNPGTNFLFGMINSSDVPTVGLTNIQGGTTSNGYGAPYRVQKATEVGVHTHSARTGGNQVSAPGNTRTEPAGGDSGQNNGLFTISTIGAVAEAYPQNPPNFGVTFIIKAL